jgi:hypothetical protein
VGGCVDSVCGYEGVGGGWKELLDGVSESVELIRACVCGGCVECACV